MKKIRLFALTSLATVSLVTIVGCAKENLNTVPVNTAEPVASVSALSDADVENAMFDLVDLPAKEEEVDAPKNDTDTMKDLGLYVDNDETILTEEEKARRRQTATSNNTKTGGNKQSKSEAEMRAEIEAWAKSMGINTDPNNQTINENIQGNFHIE